MRIWKRKAELMIPTEDGSSPQPHFVYRKSSAFSHNLNVHIFLDLVY